MGCLVVAVPVACKPFTEKFFDQLRELADIEDNLGALLEFERRYGTNKGIVIVRADLKTRFGNIEQELTERLNGIEACARRELGNTPVDEM